MKKGHLIPIFAAAIIAMLLMSVQSHADDIQRPKEIKSKREVLYDHGTYVKLAKQWMEYNKAFPSEYAYANWMYAARYAEDKNYIDLLDKGVKKYPANPTLLYLKGMIKHGAPDSEENKRYLEQAAALDPDYTDPWFSLAVNYMSSGDEEKVDYALRHILESGIILDEVFDYCYNVISQLDKNAIFITNGDNDTYPVWILTRVLNVRPDIRVVNRSLLSTEWYPSYVISQGVPNFVGQDELMEIRKTISKKIKKGEITPSPAGPFGDTLIIKLIDSAERAGRPMYFTKTMYITDKLKPYFDSGRDLGLVILVSSSSTTYGDQLVKAYNIWLHDFRTGGINSWRLKYADKNDAASILVRNYALSLVKNLDSLKIYAPEMRDKLFDWYQENVEDITDDKFIDLVNSAWCKHSDIKAIDKWCRQKGIKP